MSRIQLLLPPEAKITGALRTRSNIHNLDQDMLQIELPGSVFIDVGWYPDWDPKGEYRLVVFRDTFDNPIEPMLRSQDVKQIRQAIYKYVAKYVSGAPDSDRTGRARLEF